MNQLFKRLRFEPLLDLEIPRGKGRAGPKAARFNTRDAVSERIERNATREPQVFVKVTSWSKSARAGDAALDYNSRVGEIEIENEAGVVLPDAASIAEAQRGWFLRDDLDPKKRKTVQMVLAMPKETDPQKVLEGARRFAREEFGDRQYFLALHIPGMEHAGDRHPDHPHVHLQVKSLNDRGERLRISPPDLARMREVFAEKMREQGVRANASSRIERGKAGRRPASRKAYEQLKNEGRLERIDEGRLLPDVRADYRTALSALVKKDPSKLPMARAAMQWLDGLAKTPEPVPPRTR